MACIAPLKNWEAGGGEDGPFNSGEHMSFPLVKSLPLPPHAFGNLLPALQQKHLFHIFEHLLITES